MQNSRWWFAETATKQEVGRAAKRKKMAVATAPSHQWAKGPFVSLTSDSFLLLAEPPPAVFRPPGSAHNSKPSRRVTSVGTAYVTSFVCAACAKCEILVPLVEIISGDNRSIGGGGIISAGRRTRAVVALGEIMGAYLVADVMIIKWD